MKGETLEELTAAFEGWRSRKRQVREPVPSELRERAHRAVDTYGLRAVAMATKLDQTRLKAERVGRAASVSVPSYSRMQLGPRAEPVAQRPLAEVETPTGLRVRIFAQTAETVGLVRSLLAMGGAG